MRLLFSIFFKGLAYSPNLTLFVLDLRQAAEVTMSGSSGVWARLANDEALLEAAANDVLNNLIDEAIRGQAFEIHRWASSHFPKVLLLKLTRKSETYIFVYRAVKTGMYLITDPDLAQVGK